MLVAAWGLNSRRGGLAMRERARGDRSKGEDEEIARGDS